MRSKMKSDHRAVLAALAALFMTAILAAPVAMTSGGEVTSVFAITAPGVLA